MKILKKQIIVGTLIIFLVLAFHPSDLWSQSTLDCSSCHPVQAQLWQTSRHSNTQMDVAEELAAEWAGLPPDSVIYGSAAENCIACHGPLAVTVNGGMSEVDALYHFFTTTDGVFTDSTMAADTTNWPHVACVTCHNVPDDHPASLPALAIFNSTTAQYDSIGMASTLCGQCHGSLRFPDTDHLRYDAWKISRHGHGGQVDVAGELAEEWAGSTPDEVINGPEAENCIACHAPTAVLVNGGVSEAEALANFFTTVADTFSAETQPADTAHWPDVSCTACHNPMHPDGIWYFNSTKKTYQEMASSQELCGQCHGNLRFADTDHLSYNILTGTGGVGVPDTLTMPGATCVDCHMHQSQVEDTKSLMYGGHSWAVFVEEDDGSVTASCTSCHSSMDADQAQAQVDQWQEEFATLDSLAQVKVTEAENALSSSPDSLKQAYLEEAQYNLFYAESDESGGFHNHKYVVALLNDAVAKADYILTGVIAQNSRVPQKFELYQNYPNPFNPATTIRFEVSTPCKIELAVYNALGQVVKVLKEGKVAAGSYELTWNGTDSHGNVLPTGIYFYKLTTSTGFQRTRKMLLMK